MTPKTAQRAAFILLWAAAAFTVILLLLILAYILVQGIGKVNPTFLLDYPVNMGKEGGILPAIIGTVYFTVVTIAIAAPIGIGAAIYLTEYMQEGRLTNIIRFGTEALAGVPSIVFGLFGFALFVIALRPVTHGWSILSGALTGATMILPTIIRTAEEAIKAVPGSYREGSYALGANKIQTIRRVVLPAAMTGIVTGIVLGIGRVIGETAALLLTLGGSLRVPASIFEPARTLSLHLYLVAMEVGAMDMAFGTAAVLVLTVLAINLTATSLMHRLFGRARASRS